MDCLPEQKRKERDCLKETTKRKGRKTWKKVFIICKSQHIFKFILYNDIYYYDSISYKVLWKLWLLAIS